MARILILDQDRQFLAGLYETLSINGEHEVVTTVALREACLIVSQQPQRALTRIAQANAGLRTYQELQPTHIHLVVTCPPGRDSSWAAHRFKSGNTQEIQAQFGIQANVWLPGYVAIPLTKPLDAQDLALFLSRPVLDAVS